MNDMLKQDKIENNKVAKWKASFSGRKFRSGAYVSMLSAIVVVIVLVINLFVSELNIKVDLSTQNLYTLSDETEAMLKSLKDDVTIYYMAAAGQEYPEFQEIVEKYDNLSSHINLEAKDPILYPKFASQYVDVEIAPNSFIVVNNNTNRAKYIDSSEMILQEFDYNTYTSHTTGIDVEGKLSTAIQYVVNPDLPVMYVVEGHGELETGEVFKELMERQNVKIETLATLTQSSIPENCDMLFINAPSADFSEDEITMIKDYMAAGGNAIITLNYLTNEMPNLKSFIDYYGIEIVDGFLVEGDSNKHLPNNPHYLVPDVIEHDITNTAIDNKVLVIAPVASGLIASETSRSSLVVEPLLSTSNQAYSKVNINTQTLSEEEGDIDGPFNVGVIATDTFNDTTSNLVVYTSEAIFGDNVISSYGNGDILTGSVRYLSGENAPLAIASKSIIPETIYLTQQQSAFWGALTVIVIPIIILGIGVYVSLRRRKR